MPAPIAYRTKGRVYLVASVIKFDGRMTFGITDYFRHSGGRGGHTSKSGRISRTTISAATAASVVYISAGRESRDTSWCASTWREYQEALNR